MKRIAIQLYGHLRTFKDTFESFNKYIIEPNRAAGYEIDVFIHTWDVIEFVGETWHNENKMLSGKKISKLDIDFVEKNYMPVVFEIEEQTDSKAGKYSGTAVNNSRIEYAIKNNIDYEWVITTRPDIKFLSPFIPDDFIATYYNTDLSTFQVPFDTLFVGNNIFGRQNVADPRYVNEWDLIWFAKPDVPLANLDRSYLKMTPVKYQLNKHFIIMRSLAKKSFKERILRHRIFLLKMLPYFIVNNEVSRLEKKLG